jgi:hypothetical protein
MVSFFFVGFPFFFWGELCLLPFMAFFRFTSFSMSSSLRTVVCILVSDQSMSIQWMKVLVLLDWSKVILRKLKSESVKNYYSEEQVDTSTRRGN